MHTARTVKSRTLLGALPATDFAEDRKLAQSLCATVYLPANLSDKQVAARQLLATKLASVKGKAVTLDLSTFSPRTLLAVPPSMTTDLKIKGVILPKMETVPEWVRCTSSIEKINISQHTGKTLDLRNMKNLAQLDLGETAAANIFLPARTTLNIETLLTKSTRLIRDSDTNSPRLEKLIESDGYYKNPFATGTNLNGVATWPRTSRAIVCRDLAVWWIDAQEAKKLSGKSPRAGYFGIAQASDVGLQVDRAVDRKERHIMDSARRVVVGDKQFCSFIGGEFAAMESSKDSERYFIVASATHSMALELRIKAKPQGEKQYVLRFYDPNRTITHKRATSSDLKRLTSGDAGWTISDMVGKSFCTPYFGESGDAALSFYEVNPGKSQRGQTALSLLDDASHFANTGSDFLLFKSNAPAGLTKLGDRLVEEARNGKMTVSNALQALEAKASFPGTSSSRLTVYGIQIGMRDSEAMVTAYSALLFQVLSLSQNIDAAQKTSCLAIAKAASTSLQAVLETENHQQLRAYFNMLVMLVQAGGLTTADMLGILSDAVDTKMTIGDKSFKRDWYDHCNRQMKKVVRDTLAHPIFEGHDFTKHESDFATIRKRGPKTI